MARSSSAQQYDSAEAESAAQQVIASLRNTADEHFTAQQELALQSVLQRLLSDANHDTVEDESNNTAECVVTDILTVFTLPFPLRSKQNVQCKVWSTCLLGALRRNSTAHVEFERHVTSFNIM